MIKCNKYELREDKLLIYGETVNLPEAFKLLEEDVDPSIKENCNLSIININHFNPFRRTRDSILESEGFSTYSDFVYAYFLLKKKQLSKSRRIREMVLEKYLELIELIKEDESRTDTGDGRDLLQSNNSN